MQPSIRCPYSATHPARVFRKILNLLSYLEHRHSTSGHNQNRLQAESSNQRCGENARAKQYRAHQDRRATGGYRGVCDDEDTLREEEDSVDPTDLLACEYSTSNEQTHAVATDRHQL